MLGIDSPHDYAQSHKSKGLRHSYARLQSSYSNACVGWLAGKEVVRGLKQSEPNANVPPNRLLV